MARIPTLCMLSLLIAATSADAGPPADLDIPLTLREVAGVARTAEPVSSGVPMPPGLLAEPEGIAVFDPAGRPVPAQFKVLERWRQKALGHDDGSIKWLGVTFLADVPKAGQALYHLKAGTNPKPELVSSEAADPPRLLLTTPEGKVIALDLAGMAGDAVERGPVRTCVKYETPSARGGESFGCIVWLYRYAGSSRVDATVVLKNTANEPAGPLYFRDFSVEFQVGEAAGATRFVLGGEPGTSYAGDLKPGESAYLYQASDGTAKWQELGGGNFQGAIVMDWSKEKSLAKGGVPAFRGYRVMQGERKLGEGNCALGWAALSGKRGTAVLARRHFRENYPSAVEAQPGKLIARLLPKYCGAYGGLHWLDDATRKRFDLSWRWFGRGKFEAGDGDAMAEAFNMPLVIHCGLEWYRRTGIFGPLRGAKLDERQLGPKAYPHDYGCWLNWVVFGGDVSDRIKRRYHDYPMGGFIRGASPFSAYRTLVGANHSAGMTPLYLDDYRHPRDKDLLTVRQYCSTARPPGEYRPGTGHHGFRTWNMAHFTCRELFDAWRLFGDPLALDAAADAAAYCQFYADYRAAGGGTIAGTRSDGHPMSILAEAYRLTGRAEFLDSLKVLADASWRQVNKQRGNYGVMASWEGGKDRCEKPFMMCQVINGLIDYWELTGDERAADEILGMLDFILAEASLGEWGFTYVVKLDPGAQAPYRKEMLDKMAAAGKNTSYSHLAPTIAWGHFYSGEPRYRECIDGINVKAYPYQSRAYVNYFPERTDRTPPDAVADLRAETLGNGKVRLTWTTPPDAARLQVKWAERPMVERCWPDQLDTHANWWSATHATGEPAAKPGPQSMVVEGAGAGAKVFAIRSFDAASNRSAISHPVKLDVK